MHLLERGGGGRDGYGFLRVGWQVEGSKVEKMHRVAFMVGHHSFQMQAWRSAISAIRSCVSTHAPNRAMPRIKNAFIVSCRGGVVELIR